MVKEIKITLTKIYIKFNGNLNLDVPVLLIFKDKMVFFE